MKRQIAVIGLGRFGYATAVELQRLGHSVLVIDSKDRLINDIKNLVPHSLILDATNRDALLEAGIKSFDIVIVAIGSDIKASILCTLILKEMGVPKVIGRATDYYHGEILKRVGADNVVWPEDEVGVRIARSLSLMNVLDYMELGPEFSIVELEARPWMIGKNLIDLDLRRNFEVNIVAIKKTNEVNAVPNGDDVIVNGDTLVITGADKAIKAFLKHAQK